MGDSIVNQQSPQKNPNRIRPDFLEKILKTKKHSISKSYIYIHIYIYLMYIYILHVLGCETPSLQSPGFSKKGGSQPKVSCIERPNQSEMILAFEPMESYGMHRKHKQKKHV